MSAMVQKLVDEVKALPREQFDEFLAWLAEYEPQQPDDWDQQMERDALPGGRLQGVIDRAQGHCRRQYPLTASVQSSLRDSIDRSRGPVTQQ